MEKSVTNHIETSTTHRDAAVAMLENQDSTIKKKSSPNALLIKESMRGNLSAPEATAQLKVLCRKFAALTEKVKEETKMREEAEREVRRLKAILDVKNTPVVATCRAETQAYVRELKEAHEKIKQELRFEKEKNAMLVSQAIELEKEKNSNLLATHSAISVSTDVGVARQCTWDKQQVQKIQDTLQMTIDELQEELTRKEEEIKDYRERFQRERQRVKSLEQEICEKEEIERENLKTRKQLEDDLRQAQTEISNELQNVQRIHEQAQEDRAIRDTLEEQVETLNEVNEALQQRCNALVRRLELNASVVQDCQELKLQLRDAEVDNETLVRTIRNLKEQHFQREKDLKVQMEQVKEERKQAEQTIQELQTDVTALRTQNSLFSEWMLLRNENERIAQRDHTALTSPTQKSSRTGDRSNGQHRNSQQSVNRHHNSPQVRPFPSPSIPKTDLYIHTSDVPESPTEVQSVPSVSPGKQLQWNFTPVSSNASTPRNHHEANHQATKLNASTSIRFTKASHSHGWLRNAERSTPSSTSSVSPTTNADHERLRMLMSRNRELQQRLQQETMATQNLEQEITKITSSYAK